jgi:hypothetical protein
MLIFELAHPILNALHSALWCRKAIHPAFTPEKVNWLSAWFHPGKHRSISAG